MKKILFVDDNASLREAIVEALQLEGFQVFEADGGQMGIDLAKAQIPDLVLCDIMMPEVDGYEVYNQLKQNASTKLTPFIFLTALAEKGNIRKGMELGADDYLVKPFTLEELIGSINARIARSVEMNQQIEINLKELRQRIISYLPHELLTPLNGIQGFSDLIASGFDSLRRSEIKEMAMGIKESGNRLHTLINDYLKYVRVVTNPNIEIQSVVLDEIHQIISYISSDVAFEYEREHDLTLKLNNCRIVMAKEDFEYIIRELVDNAFKFSKPKSKVIVANTVHNEYVEFWIKDHGRGFPVENMSEIGAFNQFDRNKFEQQGSGLGLITSMLIVQRYKGELTIFSDKIGTTVSIRFPI